MGLVPAEILEWPENGKLIYMGSKMSYMCGNSPPISFLEKPNEPIFVEYEGGAVSEPTMK